MFGPKYTKAYVESMIQKTNDFYGAKELDVTNVVFVHGSMDPWNPMGRTTDLNAKAPAILIEGN